MERSESVRVRRKWLARSKLTIVDAASEHNGLSTKSGRSHLSDEAVGDGTDCGREQRKGATKERSQPSFPVLAETNELTSKVVDEGVDEEHSADSPERRSVARSKTKEANGEEGDEEEAQAVDEDGAASKVRHEEPRADRADESDGVCEEAEGQ